MVYFVPAVENAIKLLNYLKIDGHGPVSLAQACDALQIPRSTGFNIMKTLERHGFVEFDEDSKRYRLGAALMELGVKAAGQVHFVETVRPYLRALARETRLSTTFAQRTGSQLIILDKVESSRGIGVSATIGHLYPLNTGAIGKAIMAHMSEEVLRSHLSGPGLVGFTPHTVVDPALLAEQLAEVRRTGLAVSIEEFVPGVNSVAAPLFDVSGNVNFTMGVLGLATFLPVERIEEVGAMLLHFAREATGALGGHWPIPMAGEGEAARELSAVLSAEPR